MKAGEKVNPLVATCRPLNSIEELKLRANENSDVHVYKGPVHSLISLTSTPCAMREAVASAATTGAVQQVALHAV